jgi:hypothetical protein
VTSLNSRKLIISIRYFRIAMSFISARCIDCIRGFFFRSMISTGCRNIRASMKSYGISREIDHQKKDESKTIIKGMNDITAIVK